MGLDELINESVYNKFKKLLRDDIECDIENTPLVEMGIDSLDFFDVILEIEEEFKLDIPVENMDAKFKISDIANIIKEGKSIF